MVDYTLLQTKQVLSYNVEKYYYFNINNIILFFFFFSVLTCYTYLYYYQWCLRTGSSIFQNPFSPQEYESSGIKGSQLILTCKDFILTCLKSLVKRLTQNHFLKYFKLTVKKRKVLLCSFHGNFINLVIP